MVRTLDEESFVRSFSFFYDTSADDLGHTQLWCAYYFLIMAFEKAFLTRTSKARRPPGAEFIVQAIKILLDVTFLCSNPNETMEILRCAPLYLHSLYSGV